MFRAHLKLVNLSYILGPNCVLNVNPLTWQQHGKYGENREIGVSVQ